MPLGESQDAEAPGTSKGDDMIDLSIRSTGIGASEAAAALGIDPYRSRFALYCEKTGQVDAKDLSDVEAVEWGTRLEPVVVQAFGERTGRHVQHNTEQETRRSPVYPFMLATLDCTQRKAEGGTAGALEIKTTNAYASEDWKEGPPLRVQVQLQHQLAVTGFEWGTIAALIGGQKLVWYDQGRNDRFIDAMIEKERAFWDLVESKTPPPVDGSEQTAEALRRLYAADNGSSVMLPAEAAQWDDALQTAKAAIKAATETKRAIENQIKAAIGDATFGELPGGGRYKWAERERNEPAREARTITYRELRRLKK
jgi:putative phage-type endonuclease